MGQPATSEQSNRFRCSFHPYWTVVALEVDKSPVGKSRGSGQHSYESGQIVGGVGGCDGSGGRSPESGPVTRSAPVLVLRCRPGCSLGPGRLTTQVGAGDHPGQDTQPTPDRLPLLCGVRWRSPLCRRPAIGMWSPRQPVYLSAVCRDSLWVADLARDCAQSQRGIRPLIGLRSDAAPYRPSPHRSAQGCDPLQALFFSTPSTQYWGCTGV